MSSSGKGYYGFHNDSEVDVMAVEADDVNALSHVYNLGVSAGSSPKPPNKIQPYLAVSSARVVEL